MRVLPLHSPPNPLTVTLGCAHAHEKSTNSWLKPCVSSVHPDVQTLSAHFHGTGQPERRLAEEEEWWGRSGVHITDGGSARWCGMRARRRSTCGRLWRTALRWGHDFWKISHGIGFCCAQQLPFQHSGFLKPASSGKSAISLLHLSSFLH